jgi:PAS domain S-box-containing protein
LSDYSIEKRYIHKDGSTVWVHLFGNFVMNDVGEAVQGVAVAIDITEQRAAAAALADSRERLVLAKTAASLGIHDWDIRTNIISWDERMREIWGATADEPITSEVFIAGVHQEDIPHIQAAMTKALDPAGGGQYQATFRVINRVTRQVRWVDATGQVYFENGAPVRLIGTVQDVSDRAAAQSLVHESEARFRELANNIDQFAWTCDSTGCTDWHNERWYEYTGATAEQTLGRGWTNMLHPEQRSKVIQRLEDCLPTGTAWEDTFQLRSQTGEYRWFLSRAVPIRSEDGSIVRWFGTNTDVTDLRHLQMALDEASARKDEFLAMLSHELRNPAAAISNAAHALARLLEGRNQERGLLGVIDRQIRHMSKLLDDLLDVARITQGHIEINREMVSIQACIDLALETATPFIRSKGHRFTTTQWFEPLWISGDAARLAQCITNLLTNAAKYTPAGGTIRLELDADETTVTIEVQDNGQGISPKLLPHIFDLFVQGDRSLDRAEGGLGIGLALCRKLIEMQGGSIVASSPGTELGATFTIRLPRAKAPAPMDGPLLTVPKPRHRVLIVDDNRDAAQSLDLIMQLEGHTTLVAFSGQEALEQVTSFQPEFALLDIGLPEMDGYEIARRMKMVVPRTTLIAVTGYGLADDRARSQKAGFAAHLVKPVNIDAIEKVFSDFDPARQRSV